MLLKAAPLIACLFLSACSDSNNLLLGTVSAQVEGHRIVVTDCYRTEVPPPQRFDVAGAKIWRYTPCRDVAIEIQDDKLVVNGRSYGHIERADGIRVDHGVVSVNHASGVQRAGN